MNIYIFINYMCDRMTNIYIDIHLVLEEIGNNMSVNSFH